MHFINLRHRRIFQQSLSIYSLVCMLWGSAIAQDIKIVPKEEENHSIVLWIENTTDYTQSVKLDCELKGMVSSGKLPITIVVPAKSAVQSTELTPKNIYKSYSYATSIKFVPGDVTAIHDDHEVYYLPFPTGQAYRVDQGYLGSSTHQDTYALDFDMPSGSEITAVRDGTVIKVIDKFDKGCPNMSCHDFNNHILVMHEDGSIADYSHLQKKGAKVKEGDQVRHGQVIALSGATGWASGPHLHLEIYVPRWKAPESVKAIYFLSKEKSGIPQEGLTYSQDY